MAREEKTVAAMIHIYCHDHHGATDNLCTECAALADYARLRLEKCPYQDDKPTCANCPIHCYRLEMRDRIRTVMRYAGPRMLLRHPVLAVLHLSDGFKKAPSGVSARTR
jgi:hypothetical protein